MFDGVVKGIIAIIFGVMVYGYFQNVPLLSFNRVQITYGAGEAGTVDFQYRYAPVDTDFSKYRTRELKYEPGAYMTTATRLQDARVSEMRLRFTQNSSIDIASIELTSPFRDAVSFDGIMLFNLASGNDVAIEMVADNVVRFTATGGNPMVDFKTEVVAHQSLLSVFVPVIAAAALFLLLLPWHWSHSVINQDLNMTGADPRHINALDGLRALAALAVVGDHSWGWMSGSGTFGVWIFFALSGYLLLQPIIRQPKRAFSAQYMVSYLRRRSLRIIPLYYAVLLVFYLADRQMDKLFQHMLFIRGDGHLWSLPEEIFFYICLPVIALLIGLCSRLGHKFALVVLVLVWFVLIRYPSIIPFKAYVFDGKYILHLGWFIGGGVAAFLVYLQGEKTLSLRWQNVISLTALVVFIMGIAYSSIPVYEHLYGRRFAAAKILPMPFAIISAFLVWAFSVTPQARVSKLLATTPLRLTGMVGFGLYLIHPMVLKALDAVIFSYSGEMADGKLRFLLTALISIWLAAIAYKLIERPFLQIAKKQ